MIQKRTQLSVFAVAALAIVALIGIALLASGGAPAQATATIIAPGVEGNSMPQQQTPATPEACPGEEGNPNAEAARVVDSGHIALFDVWWNPDEGELTNSSCPPTVEHVPAQGFTPARDNRSPSSINIDETIIHIPSSAMATLNESDYPKSKYQAVWEADDAENPDGDGDRMVWALKACPPTGSPPADGLCISFSAALLDPAYWDGDIEYIVTHVHQVDIDKQDRRYVLAYDLPDGEAGRADLRWDSSDQQTNVVQVAPGGYDRPTWFFPSRGAYEFQVFIEGNPDNARSDARSKDPSVSSDFRRYILHVGAESDLGVAMTVEPALATGDTTLDPGDNVAITINASNAGPDTAPSARVDVPLPEGLTYSAHRTETGTYDPTAGVWTFNQFANGASATLAITATVDAGTHGQLLTVHSTISATETLTTSSGTHKVPVPDKNPANDMDTGATTVATSANVAPMFIVAESVPENSPPGTVVGDPVAVQEPDDGDTLTFGLTGDGAGNFAASADANGNAQITVADGAHLNYEHKRSYDLVLTVSDGKDASGNADPAVDHNIGVQISLEDVDETVTATVQVTKHPGHITWTFTVANPPADATRVFYRNVLTNTTTERVTAGAWSRDTLSESFTHDDGFIYDPGTYRVAGIIQYVVGDDIHQLHADIIGDQTITFP